MVYMYYSCRMLNFANFSYYVFSSKLKNQKAPKEYKGFCIIPKATYMFQKYPIINGSEIYHKNSHI